VTHLGSAEVELERARSPSRQVPLGDVDPHVLPQEVRSLWEWAQDSIDVASLRSYRTEVLNWLRQEYSS
jgi:hypothetical protein